MVNYQGQYLDDVGNIEINPPSCVLHEVWVSIILGYIFTTFHREVKGNVKNIYNNYLKFM